MRAHEQGLRRSAVSPCPGKGRKALGTPAEGDSEAAAEFAMYVGNEKWKMLATVQTVRVKYQARLLTGVRRQRKVLRV